MSPTQIFPHELQSNIEPQFTLREALKEIHFFRSVVPERAYAFFTKHQVEANSHLLDILSKVISRHDKTGNYFVAHIHAILLLSQFREQKAYHLIINLLSLPIESIDQLIGDMLTETIPTIISCVYDGNPEPLYKLLIDPNSDIVICDIIGQSLVNLMYQKQVSRESVQLKLQEIVACGEMNQSTAFYTALACLVLDSRLEPLSDIVRASFKQGLVDEHYVDCSEFEECIKKPITRDTHYSGSINAKKELLSWGSYDLLSPTPVKIERNTQCPCGSGYKFKHCCIHML